MSSDSHARIFQNELEALRRIHSREATSTAGRSRSEREAASVPSQTTSSSGCCADPLRHFVPIMEHFQLKGRDARSLSCLAMGRLGSSLKQRLEEHRKNATGVEGKHSVGHRGKHKGSGLDDESCRRGLMRGSPVGCCVSDNRKAESAALRVPPSRGLPLPEVKEMLRNVLHALDHMHR